jgi:hypothetical protein
MGRSGRGWAVVALAWVGTALAGCAIPEDETPEEAYLEITNFVRHGRYEEFYDRIERNAREKIMASHRKWTSFAARDAGAAAKRLGLPDDGSPTPQQVASMDDRALFAMILRNVDSFRERYEPGRVTGSKVDGDRADLTVVKKVGGREKTETVRLVRVDQVWMIAPER